MDQVELEPEQMMAKVGPVAVSRNAQAEVQVQIAEPQEVEGKRKPEGKVMALELPQQVACRTQSQRGRQAEEEQKQQQQVSCHNQGSERKVLVWVKTVEQVEVVAKKQNVVQKEAQMEEASLVVGLQIACGVMLEKIVEIAAFASFAQTVVQEVDVVVDKKVGELVEHKKEDLQKNLRE